MHTHRYGHSILVAAQSNVAVDNLVESLNSLGLTVRGGPPAYDSMDYGIYCVLHAQLYAFRLTCTADGGVGRGGLSRPAGGAAGPPHARTALPDSLHAVRAHAAPPRLQEPEANEIRFTGQILFAYSYTAIPCMHLSPSALQHTSHDNR